MPEGDSVYQLSKRLQWMQHREVTATSIRVPRFATVDFTGMTCERVWPYGKHLFMEFSREGHESQVLHTHLKMEGTWAIHRAGTRWRKPGHTARVVLRLADAPKPDIELVGHSLGLVEVFPARDYPQRMGYLGPDMLARDFDQEEVVRRISEHPHLEMGRALLNQRFVAGIGNEYRAEIHFIAGTHPSRTVGEVDVEKHVAIARRLMWANKDSPVRVTTGIKRAGETSYVFGRNNKPCRRCGTLIEKGFLGGAGDLERVIWWCPQCQPPSPSWSGE
ncbi:DNA-formamidopyrimidine glycosylase family protein [Corynebacterium pseudogenitalium]|uniref:DNA-(apurinic or apyrimidinic site) lyase n=2 Tax=Bacteria TaxID=2 RepID=A0ABD4TMJ9_9CORY|nr:DNA-formamidopyrimidine glycosylase family protein [Corynebacterium pseudogenitalium]MCQ4613563.1 Fpg/Nei family DNA glycosylase [Corynebacterium pseudogenitalium]UUA87937.1 Fpg/Nei family DNA glycosylase [Corynebacterium pseudogenitalium]